MRNTYDFNVETEADLEVLDSRVRYAMETATRKRFDCDVSKKVTARIFGEKTWSNLVQSVAFRQSAIKTSRVVDHYLTQGLPLSLKVYNIHRFIFNEDNHEGICDIINKTIEKIFGSEKDLFINTKNCTDLDLLYLIYKADRFAAKSIIYNLREVEYLNSTFDIGSICEFCRCPLEILGRCLNRNCLRFLRPCHQNGDAFSSFDIDFVFTCRNGQSFIFDAAPFLESVIINTNRINLLTKHITSNGLIHNSYNKVISKFYDIKSVNSVSISESRLNFWIDKQRKSLSDRINLRIPS